MAQKKTKTTKKKSTTNNKSKDYNLTNQQKLIFGSFLIIIGVLLCLSFISYFFTGNADQSIISEFASRDIKAENWLNKVGAWTSDVFIRRGFGLPSFMFSGLIFISGIYVLLNIKKTRLGRHWFWGTLIMIWSSILFGFISQKNTLLGGIIGYEISAFFKDYIGSIGVFMMLFFGLILYLAIRFKFTVAHISKYFKKAKKEINKEFFESTTTDSSLPIIPLDNSLSEEANAIKSALEIPLENVEPITEKHSVLKKNINSIEDKELEITVTTNEIDEEDDLEMTISSVKEERSETDNLADKLVEDFGRFDPTLELGNYQFPNLDLLKNMTAKASRLIKKNLKTTKIVLLTP